MDKHLIFGLLIPAIFLLFTGLVKSAVKKQLLWSNFYLGLDIALAAMANAIVNIVDSVHSAEGGYPADFGDKMVWTASFLVCAFGALLILLLIHQRWEDAEQGNFKLARGIWLGVVSNGIGAGALLAFILLRLKRYV